MSLSIRSLHDIVWGVIDESYDKFAKNVFILQEFAKWQTLHHVIAKKLSHMTAKS